MAVGEVVSGGIVAAKGFRVAGVRCGIKRKRRDVAVLTLTEQTPLGVAAGVMTQNFMCAPSVTRNREILASTGGRVSAVVINAGNANVGNGPQGDDDNRALAHLTADLLHLRDETTWDGRFAWADTILTASTGIIGHPLPMDKIAAGIAECAKRLSDSPDAASEAAEAILTTDTFIKEYAVRFLLDEYRRFPSGFADRRESPVGGKTVHIGGMAKGSGMIAPNMATMLAFLTTDVRISPSALDSALREAVAVSFNCLTVDSDTSTSDQCLVLASGAAGNDEITVQSENYAVFVQALTEVCVFLAKEVARDGEGATKLITVRVTGATDFAGARQVAKSIAESPLVKTALFGNDPNWGRLLMAAGKAGVPFDPHRVTASLAGTGVFRQGQPTQFDAAALSRAMAVKDLEIHLDLGQGDASATVYTCDFSYDYVKINAEYHT